MATKCALGRLFWNQSIFVRVAFDVVLNLSVVFVVPCFLHGRCLLQHLSNFGGVPESCVLHQLVVPLIVEAVLADAVAMELMLGVPGRKLKAIARVLVLAGQDGGLAVLDLFV